MEGIAYAIAVFDIFVPNPVLIYPVYDPYQKYYKVFWRITGPEGH
jgi:hypothetical protein